MKDRKDDNSTIKKTKSDAEDGKQKTPKAVRTYGKSKNIKDQNSPNQLQNSHNCPPGTRPNRATGECE